MRIAKEALTFDDVLLQPGYSDVLPREVDLSTQLTSDIDLNIPLLSAAMDTVTESPLAIALAQEGGMGIIHKNMSPQDQALEVLRVKKFESGIVKDPITVTPDITIREVIELTQSMGISGMPVVDGKETTRSPIRTIGRWLMQVFWFERWHFMREMMSTLEPRASPSSGFSTPERQTLIGRDGAGV